MSTVRVRSVCAVCAVLGALAVAGCARSGADGPEAPPDDDRGAPAWFVFGPQYDAHRARILIPLAGEFGCADMGVGGDGPRADLAGHWLDLQLVVGPSAGWVGEYRPAPAGCSYATDGRCFRWIERRDGEVVGSLEDDAAGDRLEIAALGATVRGTLRRAAGPIPFDATECGKLGPAHSADGPSDAADGPWRLRFR